MTPKEFKRYSSAQRQGFKATGAIVALHVTDIARSRDFYSSLLGMKVITTSLKS